MFGSSLLPVPCGVPGVCSSGPSLAGGLSSSLASTATSAFLDVLKSSLADAADWMVGHVIDLVNATTAVNLTTGWFPASFTAIRDISVLVVLPILMAASIGPVLRQDPRRLFRVWGVGLPVAALSGLLGTQFVQLALALTDKMCIFVSGGSLQMFSRQFSSLMVSSLMGGAPPIVAMLVSSLLILGTLVVWLELVVRTASVYIAVFFMPLALVTFIWPATAGIAKRTIEILAALILSKFVIVAGLTLGLSAVNGGSSADDAVAGAAILLLSGFTPFALLRLAPVVETAAIGHLEGMSRRPLRAAARAATSATGARSHPAVKFLLSGSGTGGSVSGSSGGGGGAGGSSSVVRASRVTAAPLPERRVDFPVETRGRDMDDGAARYSFQPLERRGVLLGLGPLQLGCALAGVIAALTAGRLLHGTAGLAAAVALLAVSLALALVTRQGAALVAWAPILGDWAAQRARGTAVSLEPFAGTISRETSPPEQLHSPRGRQGQRVRQSGARRKHSRVLRLPGIEVTEAAAIPGQPGFGVVRDTRASSLVAVVPVVGGALGLLDIDEQVKRLDAWRGVLAALSRTGGSLQRIQWVESSGPCRSRAALPGGDSRSSTSYDRAGESYAELLAGRGPSRAHEVLIAVAVGASTTRRLSRQEAFDGLRRELRLLDGQLRRADLAPGPPLGAGEVLAALAPVPEHASADRIGGSPQPGPMATLEEWSTFRRDGECHATYWIAEWPRVDVAPDFLTPLLVSEGRRTVSVVMAPVPMDRAVRQARSARTADLADEEIRSRAGFLPSARRRREAEGATEREEELASGHVEYRFSGYVTVSAHDPDSLVQACAETQQAAQESHLELRRLYGRQADAFTWTLPLTRGLG